MALFLLATAFLFGCDGDETADAYGNFEATEVTVSAEAQGRLVHLRAAEGDRLQTGDVVGRVDTTKLALQRRALLAQRQSLQAQRMATLAQLPEIQAQVAVLRAQLETAEEELARTRRLHDNEAATARELNQREGEVMQLRKQIEQARTRVSAVRQQAASTAAQVEQLASQVAELDARISDAQVVNPVAGTVLTRVAEQGEFVQPGAPLYTVANLDTLTLHAYATGRQLPELRLGMHVQVLVDGEAGRLHTMPGEVVWIADEAQFTPTPIQTRENRAELVYAFDVRVPNPEGRLKIGMPGEVLFGGGEAGARERGG